MEFRYKAIDSYGSVQHGNIQAKSEMDVELRLENQGLDLISCKPNRAQRFRLVSGQIARRDLINMVFHLEQLTASGVPLLDGLTDLKDSVGDDYFRDVLTGVVDEIEGGSSFSAALAKFPGDFDEVFVALIAIGEEAGELPKVLHEMGVTMRKSDELISDAKRVMTYPLIVAVIIACVAAFLLLYLVPKVIPFVQELGSELPFHTIALLATSNFVSEYWWLILLTPVVITFTIRLAARSRPEIRLAVDALKLRVPLIGPLGLKIRLARFATYMALLYGAGVTVIRSLEIIENLIDNAHLRKAIVDARQRISDGTAISASFTQVQIFPPLVLRMLKVGETTGNLDEALQNVTYFYEREIQETIETIEPAISPILTMTMGTLLGWIMISVLGPVWTAATGIG